jgi:hypothetical protein
LNLDVSTSHKHSNPTLITPDDNRLGTMASTNEISEPHVARGQGDSGPTKDHDQIAKTATVGDDAESKELSTVSVIDDVAALPKGTIDPVYEAKARVLNHAVWYQPPAR